jgi:hypothetical protein
LVSRYAVSDRLRVHCHGWSNSRYDLFRRLICRI